MEKKESSFKDIGITLGVIAAIYIVLALWLLISPPGIIFLLIMSVVCCGFAVFALDATVAKDKQTVAIVGGIVAGLLLVGAIVVLPSYIFSNSVEFQVIKADREPGADGSKGDYMVSVRFRDGSTDKLKNVDAPQFFKIRSGTLQTKFEEQAGKNVWFHGRTFGFRSGLISSYPNIISATAIKS